MIRILSFLTAINLLFAQPSAFTKVDLYPTGATPGYLRLFEVRANGSNHVALQAADSIASDCTHRISDVAFTPCFNNQTDWGSSALRLKKIWAQDADINSGLTVGGNAGFSGNITFSGNMNPLFTNLGSIGVSSFRYASGFINAISAVTVSASTSITTTDLSLTPLASTAPGVVRFYERVANGTNHSAIQGSDSITNDYTYIIGDAEFRPGTNNAADLGGPSFRWKKLWTQDADVNGGLTVGGTAGFSGNISFSSTMTPLFAGLGSIGTASLPYGTINGSNVVAQSTFRLGSSATSGLVLMTDASGFGTWQAITALTSINGMTNAAQTITIGTSGFTPNVSSSGGTTTLNIPQASLTNDGTVTAGTQTFGGAKTFSGSIQMNSTLNVSGATTVPALTVGGNAGFSGTIVFSSNMTPLFDGLGSIGVSGTRYGDIFAYRGNFSSGLTTGSSANSTIYVGSGNFYNRTFSGSPSCAGITDGWQGVDTFNLRVWVCVSGTARYLALI